MSSKAKNLECNMTSLFNLNRHPSRSLICLMLKIKKRFMLMMVHRMLKIKWNKTGLKALTGWFSLEKNRPPTTWRPYWMKMIIKNNKMWPKSILLLKLIRVLIDKIQKSPIKNRHKLEILWKIRSMNLNQLWLSKITCKWTGQFKKNKKHKWIK